MEKSAFPATCELNKLDTFWNTAYHSVPMRANAYPDENRKVVRIAAMVTHDDARLLNQGAEENGRSLASEIRLAIDHWLRSNGRRAAGKTAAGA